MVTQRLDKITGDQVAASRGGASYVSALAPSAFLRNKKSLAATTVQVLQSLVNLTLKASL